MRIKIFISVCLFFFSLQVFSQWTDSGATIYTMDKVGIGTSGMDNNVFLRVQGTQYPAMEIAAPNTRLQIGIPTLAGDFSPASLPGDAVFRPLGTVNGHQGILFSIPNVLMNGASYFAFGDDGNGAWMKIFNNKTVKMDGKLYAKEIEVKTNVWADYVFKPDYKLIPINELENFITENNHLPNIPTEAEVISNGINVAEMNAKLLQKIEELTLYMIGQQKQIVELNQRITSLSNK